MHPISIFRLCLASVLALGLVLAAGAAMAASDAALRAARDAAAPGECDIAPSAAQLGRIRKAELPDGGGTLYLVPCRSTAFDIVSVAVLERSARLRALVFPDPGFARKDGWGTARMARIGVTDTLLSPTIAPGSATLTSSARIPPGMGSGVITKSYRIDGGQPELLRYAIVLDGRAPIVLWQSR
jgi:hypothetical protein